MIELKLREPKLKEYVQIKILRHNERPLPYLTDPLTHIWDRTRNIVPGATYVADIKGELVGVAGYAIAETDHELGLMGIIIKPEYQRRGGGGYIYKRLCEKLYTLKARRILTMIYDNQLAGLRFAVQRGFQEIGRSIIGQLDMATINMEVWPDPEKMIADQNLRFTTLNRFPRRGLAERLLPIWNRTRPDQPQYWPYVPFNVSRLEREVLDSEAIVWEHSIVIITPENRIVGLTLNLQETENRLFTFYTGIDPDFRGRKLGFALKLKLIMQAQAHDIDFLAAENEVSNRMMWRINKQLGFCRLRELIVYQKTLET